MNHIYVLYTLIVDQDEHSSSARTQQVCPPAYRQRLQRMRSAAARRRTQTGLALLAHALAALGHPPRTIDRIGFCAHGRPTIVDAPAFSISHSDMLVACAVACNAQAADEDPIQVGLDVEARREHAPPRLARLLTADESAVATREPQRFYDFWCAREATVKASGRVGLARIRGLAPDADSVRLDGQRWRLRALDIAAGYAACLATDRAIDDVTIEQVAL